MKVLDVKDVKVVTQPGDDASESEKLRRKSAPLVFPSNNLRRVMLMPSVLLVQVFNILMSFATIFIWLVYTQFGSNIAREGTVVFLIASIMFLLNFLYSFRSASNMVEKVLFAPSEKRESTTAFTAVKSGNNVILEMLKFDSVYNFAIEYFYMEGKYFLLKLNISEIMEHVNQVINIFSIYNCNLTVGYAWSIYAVLAFEALHNSLVLLRGKITVSVRDHQAMVDLFIDFFCTGFPLFALFYGQARSNPIPVLTALQVCVMPLFGIYAKLRALQSQLVIEKLRQTRYDAEQQASATQSRRRMSLFGETHEQAVIKRQLHYFPRWLQLVFFSINFVFGALLVSLLAVQTTTVKAGNDKCLAKDTAGVWERCVDQIMFCGDNPFVTRCNCLSLSLAFINERHNFTELPYSKNGIMNEMAGLSYMDAFNGPLHTLPGNFCEIHPNLKSLWMPNNSLPSISLEGCTSLVFVSLSSNKLNEFPDLRNSQMTLRQVILDENKISKLPMYIAKWHKSPVFLFSVSRNNISNEDAQTVFSGLSQVIHLDLSSNPMVGKLPNAVYNLVSLEALRLFNLPRLKEFPDVKTEQSKALDGLQVLDIRNTSISRLPSLFLHLKSLEYVFLEGSPLCYNGWLESVPKDSKFAIAMEKPGAGCAQQCSINCNHYDLASPYCEYNRCMSPECNYQNGKCGYN